mmetsp:Transcript_82327/g.150663  ORF Transcript_82327/g.150663 Transcript_82327/m.150663 type:complete len:128 (+) Transcript_82327:269-652(+)
MLQIRSYKWTLVWMKLPTSDWIKLLTLEQFLEHVSSHKGLLIRSTRALPGLTTPAILHKQHIIGFVSGLEHLLKETHLPTFFRCGEECHRIMISEMGMSLGVRAEETQGLMKQDVGMCAEEGRGLRT